MKHQNPWLRAGLLGLAGIGALLLLTAAAAKLIESGKLPSTAQSVACYGITALSALGACLLSAFSAPVRRLLMTALTGGVFFAVLCGLHAALSQGGLVNVMSTAGIVLGAVLLASLAAAGKGKDPYRL